MSRTIMVLAALGAALVVPGAARADALLELRATDLPRAAAVAGVEPTGHGTSAVATPDGLAALRAAGVDARVVIADLAAQDRADRAAEARRATPSALPSGRTEYRRLADFERELGELAAAFPRTVRPLELAPRSLQGRTIRGIEITHDAARTGDGKPVFLQLGVHHAREWPSGEHAMEFAHDLLRNDGEDPRITSLLDRVRVIVVPVVNPDGFHASRESPVDPQTPGVTDLAGIVQNGTAYRRKNCRRSQGDGVTQAPIDCDLTPGVDLNRNYGVHWGSNGASSQEAAPDYRGGGPFSEPESEAVRRLVTSRAVTMLITNHTSGNLVLRPPGTRDVGTVPDEDGLRELGRRFTEQNGYVNQRSWELYDNSGTTEDWSYGITGGYGFTFEINTAGFHPDHQVGVVDEYLGSGAFAGKGNRAAYLLAMEHAADAAAHGVVEGFAPPGRTLTARRTVRALTDPICVTQPTGFASTPCGPTTPPVPFTDVLESRYEVGPDGVVDWHLNPSDSPVGDDDGRWTIACGDETAAVRLPRGDRARVDLACGLPPCRATRVLSEVAAQPALGGRAVRFGAQGRQATLTVLRASGETLRTVRRTTSLPLTARFGPGTYVARFAAGRDVRRIAFRVSRSGKVTRGPRFARTDGCRELRVARLRSPTSRTLLLRPTARTQVTITAAGKTLRRTLPAKLTTIRLPTRTRTVEIATRRGLRKTTTLIHRQR